MINITDIVRVILQCGHTKIRSIISKIPSVNTECQVSRAPYQYKNTIFQEYRFLSRRSWYHLIFIMEILILPKRHLYIEAALKMLDIGHSVIQYLKSNMTKWRPAMMVYWPHLGQHRIYTYIYCIFCCLKLYIIYFDHWSVSLKIVFWTVLKWDCNVSVVQLWFSTHGRTCSILWIIMGYRLVMHFDIPFPL